MSPALRPIVYVVDDDAVTRQSVVFLLATLDLDARAFAAPSEFMSAYQPGVPACLLLDVRMPEMSGLELQERLNQELIELPVVFVSGHGDIPMVVRAMRQGAVDFLQKPYHDQDLLDRVLQAIDLDRRRQIERREEIAVMARFQSLTPRERDILALVVEGLTNKAIGQRLAISPKTVETHRARVMDKLHARSMADLFHCHAVITRVNQRRPPL